MGTLGVANWAELQMMALSSFTWVHRLVRWTLIILQALIDRHDD